MTEDRDPLMQVYAAREAVAARYGYDLETMINAFRKLDQEDTGRKIVPAPRQSKCVGSGYTTIIIPDELLASVQKLINEWQKA